MTRWRVMIVLACCAAMSACAAKPANSTKGEDKKSKEVVEKDGRDRAGKGGGGNGAVAGGGSATGGGSSSGGAGSASPSNAGDATNKAGATSSSASVSAKKPDASSVTDTKKAANASVDQQAGNPASGASTPAAASSASSRNNAVGDAMAKTSKKDVTSGGDVAIGGGASKVGGASASDKATVSSDKFAAGTRRDASVGAPGAPSMSLPDRVSPAVPSAPTSPELARVPAATPSGASRGSSSVGMAGVKPSASVSKTPDKPVSINTGGSSPSDSSAAPAAPPRLAWDTLLASPVTPVSSPSIVTVSADAKGDLPKIDPRARAEAIAALRASKAERVAVWSASSPKGVSLPRQEAIDRLEASGDEKVIAVALTGNDSASWQGVIERVNAERIRAEWFAREAVVKGDDIGARREKLAADREAERQGQRNLGDAFYRAILGEPAAGATPGKPGDGAQK